MNSKGGKDKMRNKKGQFAILMCVGLVAIVAFTMIDIPIASALWNETQYCDVEDCHENDEPTTWIDVTISSETAGEITYDVTGSDNYAGSEGWAVFDPLMNNIANGEFSGSFTLPKSGWTYRVFWVDNETEGTRGSAYEDITPQNTGPVLKLDGPTEVKVGTTQTYTYSAYDNQGQGLYLKWDWGDGTTEDWTGPSGPVYNGTRTHTWEKEGTFMITLRAKDQYDAESSVSLLVKVPINKPFIFNSFFIEFLEQHPRIFPILRTLLRL